MENCASKWSSGCESGWTSYLDESLQSPRKHQRGERRRDWDRKLSFETSSEDGEDLSMVSDASSGPPNLRNDEEEEEEEGEEEVECRKKDGVVKSPSFENPTKKKVKEPRVKRHGSSLEDTASSHAFSLSKV